MKIITTPTCCGRCGKPESHNVEHVCKEVHIEHCGEKYCPECNLKAYKTGVKEERDRIRKMIEEKIKELTFVVNQTATQRSPDNVRITECHISALTELLDNLKTND